MERSVRDALGKLRQLRARTLRARALRARARGGAAMGARWVLALGLGFAIGFSVPAHAAGADSGGPRLYRYKNAEGRVEISNAVPADRVAGGYEVLDLSGRVLQSVAPQLTSAQLAEKEAREREAEACRQNVERVTALYGSVQDIDAAQDQARRSLESRIVTLETNLAVERRRLEEHEQSAAQRERTGRAITPDLQQNLQRSRVQIDAITVELAQRHGEQEAAMVQFAQERRLFETGACEPGVVTAAH